MAQNCVHLRDSILAVVTLLVLRDTREVEVVGYTRNDYIL
jgi:hypothetical protein